MTTLHIIRQSAFQTTDFSQCIEMIASENSDVPSSNNASVHTVVLIDDGCYNVNHPLFNNIPCLVTVYALKNHILARAIKVSNTSSIKLVDMKDFIGLTLTAKNTVTWQ